MPTYSSMPFRLLILLGATAAQNVTLPTIAGQNETVARGGSLVNIFGGVSASEGDNGKGMKVVLNQAGQECGKNGLNKITSSFACQAAMDMVPPKKGKSLDGNSYVGKFNDPDWPQGCFKTPTPNKKTDCPEGVWFNENDGDKNPTVQHICAKGLEPITKYGNSKKGQDIIFVGDEDMDFWQTATKHFPGSFNLGVAKTTCQDLFGIMESLMLAFRPKWVVVACGENDIKESSPEETMEWVKGIHNIIRNVSKDEGLETRMLYFGAKQTTATKKWAIKLAKFTLLMEQLAREEAVVSKLPQIVHINVWNTLKSHKNYSKDRQTISKLGYKSYRKWAEIALTPGDVCITYINGKCTSFICENNADAPCSFAKKNKQNCSKTKKGFVIQDECPEFCGGCDPADRKKFVSD